MKRIIAYSSIGHMTLIILGLFSLTLTGFIGSIFLMISHGLISSALFFLIGFLYHRFHQRIIIYFSGLATIMPIFTIFLFYFSLSNIAFPLTIGFISEFLCLTGILSINFFLGVIVVCSIVLTTVYSILLFSRVCFGLLKPWLNILVLNQLMSSKFRTNYFDLQIFELHIIYLLVVLTFFFGIYPNNLLQYLLFYVQSII